MSYINEIIEMLLNDKKLRRSRSLREKVYRDEPIFKPASQLGSKRARDNDAKKRIAQMKRIAYGNTMYWRPREYVFFEQGKFMEDFEDSFERKTEMMRYYPTYNSLSNDELRTYFTWRTAVRRGEYPPISLSYVFLYVYELINGIGIKSAEDGFSQLKMIGEKYGEVHPQLMQYLNTWLTDYVVYYGLDISLTADTAHSEFENALITLIHYDERGEDEIYSALSTLSSYNMERSAFQKNYPDDFKKAAVRSFEALSDFFEKHRKNTLISKYFGYPIEQRNCMFQDAVFYDGDGSEDTVIELNEIHIYSKRNGCWCCMKYHSTGKRNNQLGNLMRAVDHMLREKYEFANRINKPKITKQAEKLIAKVIDELVQERKREEDSRIEIDLSALSGIRRAAELTREKLIVDEELIAEELIQTQETVNKSEAFSGSKEESAGSDPLPLDDAEYRFMQCLLYGGDAAAAAREADKMPSLIADSVNGKLYDIFADNVIEFADDEPVIIDDYAEELKGMIVQ